MRFTISISCWLRAISLLLLLALTSSCIQPIQPIAASDPGYHSEEVTFQHGDITLAGTLTLPATTGPHPALILISGSGPQDRNEEIPIVPGYKPFQFIAEYLTQQGIAVLRYDDRGVGKSTGDPSTATSADFALDAEAGLGYLLERPEINAKQIGLLGHSEGALIAAMLAARNPNVAFVISMAGPAVNGYDLLLVQTERILRSADLTEEEMSKAMAEQRQVLDLTIAEKWDELEAFMLEVGHQQIEAMPEEQKKALGDPEAFLQKQLEISMLNMQNWMHFFLTYNPANDWAQIKAPVLALFGALDTQVDQAQNRPAMQAALTKAGNPDSTIKVFVEANHLFQQAKTGNPAEYATLAAQFLPGFLDTIGEWVLTRTSGSDLGKATDGPASGAYMQVRLSSALPAGEVASAAALNATKRMIEQRMVLMGITWGSVELHDDQYMLVTLPVMEKPDLLVEILHSSVQLEFIDPGQFVLEPGMIINTTNTPNAVEEAQQGVSAGQILPAQIPYPDQVFSTICANEIFQSVVPAPDQSGHWQIFFETTSAGAKILSAYTAAHINQSLVIALGGRVLSAPIIQAAFGANGAITGSFTQEEAISLVMQIRYGALPVALKVSEFLIVLGR